MDDLGIEILNSYASDLASQALRKQNLPNSHVHLSDNAKSRALFLEQGNRQIEIKGNSPTVAFGMEQCQKVTGLEAIKRIKSDLREINYCS